MKVKTHQQLRDEWKMAAAKEAALKEESAILQQKLNGLTAKIRRAEKRRILAYEAVYWSQRAS